MVIVNHSFLMVFYFETIQLKQFIIINIYIFQYVANVYVQKDVGTHVTQLTICLERMLEVFHIHYMYTISSWVIVYMLLAHSPFQFKVS